MGMDDVSAVDTVQWATALELLPFSVINGLLTYHFFIL